MIRKRCLLSVKIMSNERDWVDGFTSLFDLGMRGQRQPWGRRRGGRGVHMHDRRFASVLWVYNMGLCLCMR
jgi:hypothetical protein